MWLERISYEAQLCKVSYLHREVESDDILAIRDAASPEAESTRGFLIRQLSPLVLQAYSTETAYPERKEGHIRNKSQRSLAIHRP